MQNEGECILDLLLRHADLETFRDTPSTRIVPLLCGISKYVSIDEYRRNEADVITFQLSFNVLKQRKNITFKPLIVGKIVPH